jgi:hypothetical protein
MPTLVDSYSESNYSGNLSLSNDLKKIGQSFTGSGINLTSAKFYLIKDGTPTGNLYAVLYAHSGTFGTDGVPTGSPLATSNAVTVSSLSNSAIGLITFTFSTPYMLVNGTKYVIVCYLNAGLYDGVFIGNDSSSPTHGGNLCYYDTAWGGMDNRDLIFYVYGNPATSIKTINGLAKASVKTFNGLAIDSVKTINGLG